MSNRTVTPGERTKQTVNTQVTRYNRLAAYYSELAADAVVRDAAGQRRQDDWHALSEAASTVAALYAQGWSWAKQQLDVLATSEMNPTVRQFYQTARTEMDR